MPRAQPRIPVDLRLLKSRLALLGLQQWKLAQKLGIEPATLCMRLRGRMPMPAALLKRIERTLDFKPGELVLKTEEKPVKPAA